MRINEQICDLLLGLPTGSFFQLGFIRCHHWKVNCGWPLWHPHSSCSKDCGPTKKGVGIPSAFCNLLFLSMTCFFPLPLLYSCCHGQEHCSECSRNRCSDTLWCHTVLCQATLLISSHFLRLSEPMFSFLSFWGPGAAKPSWKVSCCFSTHGPGLPASCGAGWGGWQQLPCLCCHMPGLLLSCCSW